MKVKVKATISSDTLSRRFSRYHPRQKRILRYNDHPQAEGVVDDDDDDAYCNQIWLVPT